MILAYVDSVYIEQADVFLLGIGMYSCLEWVDVWVLVAPYWQSIGSLLSTYCPLLYTAGEAGHITLSYMRHIIVENSAYMAIDWQRAPANITTSTTQRQETT
jgi:hypothetical protein